MRSVFSLRVLISSLSCVILTVLKVDMAMAAIEIPIAIKPLGQPGLEFSNCCESALMISQKSSREPLMIARLTTVTDLVIDLKGSLR
jgi:hypothetical protein